jgi:hypothetical protein
VRNIPEPKLGMFLTEASSQMRIMTLIPYGMASVAQVIAHKERS